MVRQRERERERERGSLTWHSEMLFYVMHIVLSVLWKLLEGPGSGGVTLPARKGFILDLHAVQHFLIGYRTEQGRGML